MRQLLERNGLRQSPNTRDNAFIIVMSVMFVLGMAVGLALLALWRKYPAAMTQSASYHVAVAICPPFLLVGVFSALADSTFALVLTGGTIVFANGSLYAGVAAFAYWIFSNLWPKRNIGSP
jgi:hypothetical protein